MIKFLIEKEFKQLLRNSFLPRLIFIFPCMIMILMPWAMNLEIRDVAICIVDNDHSVTSGRLIDKIAASDYFRLHELPSSYREALGAVEAGEADVILEIPHDFEKSIVNGQPVQVSIAANAVNGTKGGLGGTYLANIVCDYGIEMSQNRLLAPDWNITVRESHLNLFNPNLNYKYFTVPALVVMLLTLICGFLPTLNIVSEKEVGTIEQINVTPVSKFTFIVAKLLPYWIIGFVILTICFVLAWLLYGIVPVGHFWVIYSFAILFVFAMSGFGLVVSNHSATMQQAMFVMWFCLLIFILMSGLFTPISSMPEWAQVITLFNPLNYLMQVMRMVYLKGSGFADLLPQLFVLLAFAVFFNTWAIRSYKKKV